MSVIRTLLNLYIYLVIIDTFLNYFPKWENTEWRNKIRRYSNFALIPIREKIEVLKLPVDISPLILILLIQIFKFLW